ncbi:MAG: TonB-dependent receptor [Sphingomonadales bacterium]
MNTIQTQRMRNWLMASAAASAMLAPQAAWSQDQAESDSSLAVEEIVVLGTPGGAGVRKQDASFAITTISDEALTLASPKSTAEVFTLVPGVWAESSGGVAGANIDVRGLPGGGDAPFVTLSINGAPLYGTETLSFFEQSSIFRVDETIEATEALRGGPNAVFSNGEPGVTLNFRLKEGGEETEGRFKYTTSDYDLQRVDAFLSGKIAEGLYYAIGGYYRTSPGIRDAQFNSEEGYQFTVHITKELNRGKIGFFTRYTDDHGQWYTPQALNSGNDLGEFSQLGNATRLREIQVGEDTVNVNGQDVAVPRTQIFDFGKGRGWEGFVTGLNFDYEIGDGWFIRDNVSFTKGDADTYGLVSSGGAIQASALGLGVPVTTLGGDVLSDDAYVQNYGFWVVQKDLESFTNDLSINKQIEGHDITFGYYQANWSADDWWSLGNQVPLHNVANGDFIANVTCAQVEAAGGGGCGPFGLAQNADARSDALYFADAWQITDDLRFDVGVRHEWFNTDLVADVGPGFPDGTRDINRNVNDNAWAYTFAVNYDITEDTGTFVRFSDGFLFPGFNRVRDGNFAVNDVKQWEVGLKHSSDFFGLFLTGFYNTNDNFSSVVLGDTPPNALKTRAIGVEIDGRFNYENFNLAIIGTYQDAEIRESENDALVGNRVLRQPKWQLRVAPSYDVYFGEYSATLYGAVQAVGDRFGGYENVNTLDSYAKVDLGLTFNTPYGLFAQVHADNLTDSNGLTEADPRTLSAPNGRAILGRSFKFSIGYDF